MSFHKGKHYLREVTIDISEELNSEDTFVKFREPTTGEAFSLRSDDEGAALEAFRKLLPSILIDHNFFDDEAETTKMSNEDVVEILFSSYPTYTKVLSEYTKAVFRPAK